MVINLSIPQISGSGVPANGLKDRERRWSMGVVLLINGPELIIILIAFIILLIWGPSKIPSLARSIGEAIREFRRGSSGSGDDEVFQIAEKLGIDTRGKSRDQVLREILGRLGGEEKKSVDPKVIEIAERLGIDTKGKSEEELIKEINWRLSKK
jgi:sec-independent protein translocase protein TatA